MLSLFVAAFVQNMAFTWASRSRNSGDPRYHRYASICSNGIWFATNILIFKQLTEAMASGEYWKIGVVAAVYIIATTEGSVLMMKILLKNESGKRKVGAT